MSRGVPGLNFPSFSEGLSLRPVGALNLQLVARLFPFLFGGTFIEARRDVFAFLGHSLEFPFLFGGTFIEALGNHHRNHKRRRFPFLFGGTFIEAEGYAVESLVTVVFPFLFGGTFIEASACTTSPQTKNPISLPFRRDFH